MRQRNKLWRVLIGLQVTLVGLPGPLTQAAFGQEILSDKEDDQVAKNPSFYTPRRNPTKRRNYVWSPLASLILPGFDQWWEGQYAYAAAYSGTAFAGYTYSGLFYDEYRRKLDSPGYKRLSSEEKEDETARGEVERKIQLGSQLAFAAGSFSAYHSFRTAVTTRQPYGEFTFLRTEDKPADLVKAPVQFHYMTRLTTVIPLGIIAGLTLATAYTPYDEKSGYQKVPLRHSDVGYGLGVSYIAGAHEEALFRGFVMPVFREWTGSDFWSNSIAAVFFAAAHLNTVDVPVAQLALGWHMGWVTQRNGWDISEAIFIHAWWDVFALISSYQIKKRNPNAKLANIMLPPLEFHF